MKTRNLLNHKSASGIQRRLVTEMSHYSPAHELKRGSIALIRNNNSQLGVYQNTTAVSRLKSKKSSFQTESKRLQSQYLDKFQSKITMQPYYSDNESI